MSRPWRHYNTPMSLAAEYRQQFNWRPWRDILEEVPSRPDQTILDLGCGIGDQARELASRGGKVIGVDANQELIDEAILDHPSNCEFLNCELREITNLDIKADGIWCSFVAAYCTNLPRFLETWATLLHPAGG